MTRFARAKGSKSSNERLPEKATSWGEMKQQLVEKTKEIEFNKQRKIAEGKRAENYKTFLNEKEANDSKQSKWADFPGVAKAKVKSKPVVKKFAKKVQMAAKDLNLPKSNGKAKNDESEDETFNNLKSKLDGVLDGLNGSVAEDLKNNSDSDAPPDESGTKVEVKDVKIKKVKQKKKLLKIVVAAEENAEQNGDKTSPKPVKSKKKGKKAAKEPAKPPKKLKEELTAIDLRKIEKKKQKRLKQLEKKKRLKEEQKKEAEKNPTVVGEQVKKPFNDQQGKNPPPKPAKVRSKEEHPRKKPLLPNKMTINGKDMEVDYVDGFPVKKDDADRLKQLRREMISKGLPRSEITVALKLERRKAEKALTREKKRVCFNCRKSGHNLSECPALGTDQFSQSAGTGICFKCGSTEHTHFQCKVVRTQEFKFAQCFICNEQGHIARQCPDNARGLYPEGGGCNVCGDVTHLKRDCPRYQTQQQREHDSFPVEAFAGGNPDALEGASESIQSGLVRNKANKIIKF